MIQVHPMVPLGNQDASPRQTAVKTTLLTIDISALARNFCTAFFLSSLSVGSLFALIDDVPAGMIVVACKYDIGGEAEDVAEDDGVAMRLVVILDSAVSGCRCALTMSSLFEDGDGRWLSVETIPGVASGKVDVAKPQTTRSNPKRVHLCSPSFTSILVWTPLPLCQHILPLRTLSVALYSSDLRETRQIFAFSALENALQPLGFHSAEYVN